MKKISNIFLIIASAVLMLSSCRETSSSDALSSDTTESSTSAVTQLSTPTNIKLIERMLSWDGINGATRYIVLLNDEELSSDTNSMLLPATCYGVITVQVKATNETVSSAFSDVETFEAYLTLAVPKNLRQVEKTIYWDEVTFATGYIVKINDGLEQYVAQNMFTYASDDSLRLRVLATASDPYLRSSAYSEEFYTKARLDKPNNIRFYNGFIRWDEVEKASCYRVWLNDVESVVDSNRIEVGYGAPGVVTVKVQAIKLDQSYLDSEIAIAEITIPKITLETPTELAVNNNVLTFKAVPYAQGYQIYINGILKAGLNTNSYTLSQETINNATYVQVKATSTVNYHSSLSEKYYFHVEMISTEAELRNIVADGSYRLMADISLTSAWTPLTFNGFFDGGGHEVRDITIASTSSEVGFFSTIDGAVITNLKLRGELTSNTDSLEPCIGGLAGSIKDASITNVAIAFNITVVANNGIAKVGGVAGESTTTNYEAVHFTGSIVNTNAISGRFVGLLRQSHKAVTISRSSGNGAITVSGGEQSPTGGFIGQMLDNYTLIKESKASGTVSGPNYVGGFIGYMGYGRIQDSYSRGEVKATATSLVRLGGFIGRVEGYNNLMTNCLAMANSPLVTGTDILQGAFTGVTPGGTHATIYHNCAYNRSWNYFDPIGNSDTGRSDGITGYTTDELMTELPYDPLIWDFGGSIPRLRWEV